MSIELLKDCCGRANTNGRMCAIAPPKPYVQGIWVAATDGAIVARTLLSNHLELKSQALSHGPDLEALPWGQFTDVTACVPDLGRPVQVQCQRCQRGRYETMGGEFRGCDKCNGSGWWWRNIGIYLPEGICLSEKYLRLLHGHGVTVVRVCKPRAAGASDWRAVAFLRNDVEGILAMCNTSDRTLTLEDALAANNQPTSV